MNTYKDKISETHAKFIERYLSILRMQQEVDNNIEKSDEYINEHKESIKKLEHEVQTKTYDYNATIGIKNPGNKPKSINEQAFIDELKAKYQGDLGLHTFYRMIFGLIVALGLGIALAFLFHGQEYMSAKTIKFIKYSLPFVTAGIYIIWYGKRYLGNESESERLMRRDLHKEKENINKAIKEWEEQAERYNNKDARAAELKEQVSKIESKISTLKNEIEKLIIYKSKQQEIAKQNAKEYGELMKNCPIPLGDLKDIGMLYYIYDRLTSGYNYEGAAQQYETHILRKEMEKNTNVINVMKDTINSMNVQMKSQFDLYHRRLMDVESRVDQLGYDVGSIRDQSEREIARLNSNFESYAKESKEYMELQNKVNKLTHDYVRYGIAPIGSPLHS